MAPHQRTPYDAHPPKVSHHVCHPYNGRPTPRSPTHPQKTTEGPATLTGVDMGVWVTHSQRGGGHRSHIQGEGYGDVWPDNGSYVAACPPWRHPEVDLQRWGRPPARRGRRERPADAVDLLGGAMALDRASTSTAGVLGGLGGPCVPGCEVKPVDPSARTQDGIPSPRDTTNQISEGCRGGWTLRQICALPGVNPSERSDEPARTPPTPHIST